MRRGVLLMATWLIGSVFATTLAWAAVGVVRRNVTDRHVATLSARAVSDALDTTNDTETSTTTVSAETTTTTSDATVVAGPTTPTTRGRHVTSTTRPGSTGPNGGTSTGGNNGGGGLPPAGGAGSASSDSAQVHHGFSIIRADNKTYLGGGSFSCNGNGVDNRTAWVTNQDWKGPFTDSHSTPTEWIFRVDSNSGGLRTIVTIDCPNGNPVVNEQDSP